MRDKILAILIENECKGEFCFADYTCEECHEKAADAILALEGMNKWISVKDEQPLRNDKGVHDMKAHDIAVACFVIAILSFGLYLGALISGNTHEREMRIAINNAVQATITNTVRPSITCKEDALIKTVQKLAENGVHMSEYQIQIKIGNMPSEYPWN